MRKVIGTKTQKSPLLNGHGSWQLELALQVAEFFLKFQIIIIRLRWDLLQQACLPQEESLHLKQTVPMLVYGAEWKAVCPCLESIPIQPEAEVTSKSNEENILPMMIAAFEPLGYDMCFLLKTLYLQSGQPGVDGQLRKGGKDGITGRINLCLPKLFIAQTDSVGAGEHHLGNQLTVRAVHITIRFAHYMQNDSIIRLVTVVPMEQPL